MEQANAWEAVAMAAVVVVEERGGAVIGLSHLSQPPGCDDTLLLHICLCTLQKNTYTHRHSCTRMCV